MALTARHMPNIAQPANVALSIRFHSRSKRWSGGMSTTSRPAPLDMFAQAFDICNVPQLHGPFTLRGLPKVSKSLASRSREYVFERTAEGLK